MRQMIRRVMGAAVLSSLVLAGNVAAGAPSGDCPAGDWRLILPIHQPQAADHNGDGWLCRLDLRNGTFTFHDNVVRER